MEHRRGTRPLAGARVGVPIPPPAPGPHLPAICPVRPEPPRPTTIGPSGRLAPYGASYGPPRFKRNIPIDIPMNIRTPRSARRASRFALVASPAQRGPAACPNGLPPRLPYGLGEGPCSRREAPSCRETWAKRPFLRNIPMNIPPEQYASCTSPAGVLPLERLVGLYLFSLFFQNFFFLREEKRNTRGQHARTVLFPPNNHANNTPKPPFSPPFGPKTPLSLLPNPQT